MKILLNLGIFLSGAQLMVASTPPFFSGPCGLLSQMLSVSTTQPDKSSVAVSIVGSVALGRLESIGDSSAAQLGLTAAQLRQAQFSAPEVRACAFRAMGETGTAEAEEFLSRVRATDLGSDPTQQIWPAAQIALYDVRMRRISDPFGKVKFLEQMLVGPNGEAITGRVAVWAVNELCDRGAEVALQSIQRTIKKSWSGQYGDDEIRFCESRIRVLQRSADRVRALGAALTIDGEDERVMRWAIYQLASMNSSAADFELDRFAKEIERLPSGSALVERFVGFKQEIGSIQRSRSPRIH